MANHYCVAQAGGFSWRRRPAGDFVDLYIAKEHRRDAGATTRGRFLPRRTRFVCREVHRQNNFSGVHRFFVSQFWNFFLTSGAHTRKRTIASLRWIGSLLRGENGSRSECANRPHQGNATHRVRSKKTFPKGRPHPWPPFFISCASRIVLSSTGTLACAVFVIAVNASNARSIQNRTGKSACATATLRRKRWPPRLAPAPGRWIRNRRICKQSRASRGNSPARISAAAS